MLRYALVLQVTKTQSAQIPRCFYESSLKAKALCIVCIHVASEWNCFLLTLVRPRSDFPWKPENWLQSETTSVQRCKLASIPESRQHPTEDFKLDENWLSFQNQDDIWRSGVQGFCLICLWLKLDEQPCEAREMGRCQIAMEMFWDTIEIGVTDMRFVQNFTPPDFHGQKL